MAQHATQERAARPAQADWIGGRRWGRRHARRAACSKLERRGRRAADQDVSKAVPRRDTTSCILYGISGNALEIIFNGASVDNLDAAIELRTGMCHVDYKVYFGNRLMTSDEDVAAAVAVDPIGPLDLLLVRSPLIRIIDLLRHFRPDNLQAPQASVARIMLGHEELVRKIFDHALLGPEYSSPDCNSADVGSDERGRMKICADLLQALAAATDAGMLQGGMPQTVARAVHALAQTEVEDALQLDVMAFVYGLEAPMVALFNDEERARAVATTQFLGHLFLVEQLEDPTADQFALALLNGMNSAGPQRADVHVECLHAFMSLCKSKIDCAEEVSRKLMLFIHYAEDGDLRAKMQAIIDEEDLAQGNP